jgi:hypothetical protein
MTPIEFTGCNTTYGIDQPEYQPLPAICLPDGTVITCWELSDRELQEVLKTKRIYFKQLTFNDPLQPILPIVDLSDFIELNP